MIVEIPSDVEIKSQDEVINNGDTDTVILNINTNLGDETQEEKSRAPEKEIGPEMNKYFKENNAKLKEFLTSYEFFQGQRNSNVTWVQFMNRFVAERSPEPPPMTGAPLEYNPETRNGFVLSVFSLVFIMLLLTAAFNCVVLLVPAVASFFKAAGFLIVIPPMLIMMGLNYAMVCSQCTRHPPMNFVCLFIAVLCMSTVTAFFTLRYQTSTILYAVLATVIVVFVCMLLACSSFDFTKYLLYIVVIATAIGAISLVIGLGMLVTGTYIKPLHIAMLLVGTLMQSIILTMELQMILGGRTVELGEEDYAFGAYLLYTSIIDIFIKLLQLTGMAED